MSVTNDVRKRLTELKKQEMSLGGKWIPVSGSCYFEVRDHKCVLIFNVKGPDKKEVTIYLKSMRNNNIEISTLPDFNSNGMELVKDLATRIAKDEIIRNYIRERATGRRS